MAQVIHPSERIYAGPWLLDRESLNNLDKVIEEQWKQLEANKKHEIENAKRRLLYHLRNSDWYKSLAEDRRRQEEEIVKQQAENDPAYAEDRCSVTLTLASKVKVRESSFASASAAPECDNALVTKAEVYLICGGIKAELVVPTQEKNPTLSIVTLPEGSDKAREVFYKLRMWADDYKPDWVRILNGVPVGVWLLAFALCLSLLMLAAITGSLAMKSAWREEAEELIKKGVGPEDQGHALQLLLQRAGNYPSTDDIIVSQGWLPIAMAIVVVIAALLSIPATTVFEIGNGIGSVKRQKLYGKFLRVALPSFLILGVLASFLGSYLLDLARGR
jgi:hypothetical protein